MFLQMLGDQGTAIMRATLVGVEIGAIFVQTASTITVIPVLHKMLDRFSPQLFNNSQIRTLDEN